MRTITKTTNIFKFHELSDRAKEKACQDYRMSDYPLTWQDEWINSLKEFCKALNINLNDWSLSDQPHQTNIIFTLCEIDEVLDFTHLRLRTWLLNNWIPHLETKKTFYPNNMLSANCKSRKSKIKTQICCPFTGYCADDDLINPILEFIKTPNKSTTLDCLVRECFDSFTQSYAADMEWQQSDEFIADTAEANEWEFTQDGSFFG